MRGTVKEMSLIESIFIDVLLFSVRIETRIDTGGSIIGSVGSSIQGQFC